MNKEERHLQIVHLIEQSNGQQLLETKELAEQFGVSEMTVRREGVPVFNLQQDGTLYFDNHHTANDTLDKVDPAAVDQATAAYAVLAWLLAQGNLVLR